MLIVAECDVHHGTWQASFFGVALGGAGGSMIEREQREEETLATAENILAESLAGGVGDLGLTVVFRAVPEENVVVAECLEIPGCFSQGATQEEAHRNIQDAIRLCLSVILEDRLREVMERPSSAIDYTGITAQESVRVRAIPQLEYA